MASDIKAELEETKDRFARYRKELLALYTARSTYTPPPSGTADRERILRDELQRDVGRLLPVLQKLRVPLQIRMMGQVYPIFEEAVSGEFTTSITGQCVDRAVQVLNQAIGIVSGYDDDERAALVSAPKSRAVHDTLLPDAMVRGTRRYLESLAQEINGCYARGFYDGCAVLCRRMVESLLISAFEHANKRAAIEDENGNPFGLEELIDRAAGGKYIKLGRTSPKILTQVKQAGDIAAHDQHHITTEQDIAQFSAGFRKVVSELLARAGIQPKSS